MSIFDYRSEPYAGAWDVDVEDPPDFGQPDDITDVCAHGIDMMTGDCGICEDLPPEPAEPGGFWVNAFGQRLAPKAQRLPGDRWVAEPAKVCRSCTAVLGAGDPDVCERCDLHSSGEGTASTPGSRSPMPLA